MARFRGTRRNDRFNGTNGRDSISSGDGNDFIRGRNGSDSINGGTRNDRIYGDGGGDRLNGGTGNDKVHGGSGNDKVMGGQGKDTLWGDGGNDQLTGGRGNDVIRGGGGNDTARFSGNFADYDFAAATGGFRVIHARGSQVDGNDFVATDVESIRFADRTVATSSIVVGAEGGATVNGTGSDDIILAGSGNDTVNAGTGNDFVAGGEGNDTLNGEAGNDTLNGGGGDDTLNGGADNDQLNGQGGNDTMTGGGGNDSLTGGDGTDSANFSGNFADYDLTTTAGGLQIAHARGTQADGTDTVASDVETLVFADRTISRSSLIVGTPGNDNLTGTGAGDTIVGSAGDDILHGGLGNDGLFGLAGNDQLFGEGGNDELFGGTGIDTANFSGNLADYDFAVGAGGFQVTHARGSQVDGSDFVANDVETLVFGDQTIDSTVTAPIAQDDSATTSETAVLNGPSVLGNDFDFQALLGTQTLSVSEVNGSAANVGTQITLGSGALLTVNSNGTYTYDPNGAFDDLSGGQSGSDSFTYTVSDGNGGTDTATTNITINGSNTAPDLDAGSIAQLNLLDLLQTQIDTTITITDPDDTSMESAQVAITEGFEDGDTLVFNNQNGITGSYNSTTGVLTLTGSSSIANYETALESVEFAPGGGLLAVLGEREFTYTVSDGEATSAPDTGSTAVVDVLLGII